MAKARDGSDNKVEGMETVGNSLGRAPWQRSEMEATRGWTDRQPWEEIAWEELRWEEARRKRRQGERRGNRGK